MRKRPYVTLDRRFDILFDALRRVERRRGVLSAAQASQNGFEHILQTEVPLAFRDALGLHLGRSTQQRGVQLSQRRKVAGTRVGPVDMLATGSAGARSLLPMELSGLRRSAGRAKAVWKIGQDVRKLELLSAHPDFHRGSVMVVGLGFVDTDCFLDWIEVAAREHPQETGFFGLRDGGCACVAIIDVLRISRGR